MRLFLYIDPGTGSMLFTILIGVLGTALYFFRDALVKLRFLFSGGAHAKKEDDRERSPFAIYTDSKRYQTIFEPICDEFETRGEELVYLTTDANDNWTTVATSAAATYSSLADYIHKTFDLNPGQDAVWTPSQFHAVPEPSSGLLTLIGFAFLALRRKRKGV